MAEVFELIRDALGDYRFAILYVIALVLGFILLKGKRKLFLIPSAIMTVIVLNPFLFDFWDRFSDYGSWRLLWAIPVIPVCAALPAVILERSEKLPLRILAVVLALALFACAGTFIYQQPDTTFRLASNEEKLPQDVVRTAKILLEQAENPRVVSDAEISVYLRQVSGKIQSPYSRDILYGNPTGYAKEIYTSLVRGEMQHVADMMQARNYTFLVTDNLDPVRKELLEAAGFILIEQVNAYGIYRL